MYTLAVIARFWWLKVKALAESFKWTELESFSRQKKVSPIGYRPFVEACYNKREKLEGSKYLVKVAPDEKVKCLINIGYVTDVIKMNEYSSL